MQETDPIQALVVALSTLPLQKSEGTGKLELAGKINELLNSDFQRLISILYRIDVSETKLRQLLRENPDTDAGLLIAELMIERQIQKIKTRREYGTNKDQQRENNMDENEKW